MHSIGAALFLPRTSIHFWDEIGYEHNPYTHCPKIGKNWENGRCSCDPARSFGEYLFLFVSLVLAESPMLEAFY